MSDDDLLGGFPRRGASGGNNVVFIHNYNNVNVVSQGSNARFTGTIDDPTEILLMQYFRGTPKEADKLKVITLVQKMNKRKIDNMRMRNMKIEGIEDSAYSENTLYWHGDAGRLSCLDSMYDDAEVIKLHQEQKKDFIIKRNLCEDIVGHWLLLARCIGTRQSLHKGKNRYIGVASHMKPIENKNVGVIFIVFEVIESKTKIRGGGNF